jgi:hypothetical protein
LAETDEFLVPDDDAELRAPAEDDSADTFNERSRNEADDDDRGVGDDDEDEPHEGKIASRDIPTWKEVIGLIIAGNMESRARSPRGGGNSYRGRGSGGRGHGGGRGGESSHRPHE